MLSYFGTARQQVLDGYSRAVAWVSADPRVRLKISPQQESDWRRIAKLGDAWGLKLEALRAPFSLVQWVAGPIRRSHAESEARFRAAVAALEEAARAGSAFTNRRVRELIESLPAGDLPPGKKRRRRRAELPPQPAPVRELRPLRRAQPAEDLRKAG